MRTPARSTSTTGSPSRATRAVPAVLAAALALTAAAPALAQTAPPAAAPEPTPVAVQQPSTVTIGVSQDSGVYTFTGAVTPGVAGVPVTIARLGTDGKVTGIASTRTVADGRYEIRTSLPLGFASYYALTAATPELSAARSRLYGLIVNVRPGSTTTPTVSLDVRRGSGTYIFSGVVSGGRTVPLTLARHVGGRWVGIVGTRTPGPYTFSRAVEPGTHYFKVFTGAANGRTASSSRVYGLVVPPASAATPPAVTPVHGGSYVGVYLVLASDPADPRLRASAASASRVGYTAWTTTLGCDLGAARALRRDPASQEHATVVYFATEAAARQFVALHPPVEAGVVRVRTFCAD